MKITASLAALALALCLIGCPAQDNPPAPPTSDPGAVAPADPSLGPDAIEPKANPATPASPGNGLAKGLALRAPLSEPTIEAWLSAAVAAGDGDFVAATQARVKDEIYLYQTQSMASTGFCLRDTVDPHRGAKASAKWEARAAKGGAPDMLRCTWEAQGLVFTLIETANTLVVGVEHQAKPAPTLSPFTLRELIKTVVRIESPDHTWHYEIFKDSNLETGTHHITTRNAPGVLRMETRHDRADILVVEGRVWFLFIKKIRKRIGFEPTDTWFRDSTRRATLGA